MKSLNTLLLGLTLLGSTGCLQRYIYSVQDTPVATPNNNPSSVLSVVETRWYAIVPVAKDVYYECARSGTNLNCVKLCDVKNEEGQKVRCRFLTRFF
jgi:hypothetical protein